MQKPDVNTVHLSASGAQTGDATFRLLVNQITDYAIFLLTPAGEVATWNPGAQRIKGFKPEEIIGKHFRTFYPKEAQDAHIPEEELKVAAATGRFEDEGWRIRNDGSRFWASVIITAIHSPQGELLGYGKVTRDLTERKRSEERLRELSHSLLKLQDQERGRLGRELHDTVGQFLAAAKMSIDGLASDPPADPADLSTQLTDCAHNIERALREVRTISYLLYPPMLEEMGLASAMRWHLEGFSKRSGIAVERHIEELGRLSTDVELALFRIFQESLTNLHRHSGSKSAEVHLGRGDHQVFLKIKDQGKGLPPHLANSDASLASAGVGIRGMHERMRQVGGTLSLSSDPSGTTVRACVPLAAPLATAHAPGSANDNERPPQHAGNNSRS